VLWSELVAVDGGCRHNDSPGTDGPASIDPGLEDGNVYKKMFILPRANEAIGRLE
jgi:hypothetical protein